MININLYAHGFAAVFFHSRASSRMRNMRPIWRDGSINVSVMKHDGYITRITVVWLSHGATTKTSQAHA